MKQYYQLIRHEGNRDLFRAIEMSVAALTHNYALHIHAEGMRGMGKTTIFRAAREILPKIKRIKNCLYNCDPVHPTCPQHRHLSPQEIAALGWEEIPTPFLEISHAAKIGTVVGSIDLPRLMDRQNPAAAVLPGTIPQANRGIIFIDEINRLADTSPELTDVLLDVMGTRPGRVQIEETGLPVVHLPVRVTVWAASNPDEEPGSLHQIRRQLADRFDCVVSMERPDDVAVVRRILAEVEEYSKTETISHFPPLETLPPVGEDIKQLLARLYVEFGLESLRAMESLEMTARLAAALAHPPRLGIEHVAAVVPLVLGHRCDGPTINAILRFLAEYQNGGGTVPGSRVPGVTPLERERSTLKAEVRGGWLQQWWQKVRQGLGINRYGHTKMSQAGAAVQPQTNGAASPVSTVGRGDELGAAPPRTARSLEELSLEEYITRGQDDR